MTKVFILPRPDLPREPVQLAEALEAGLRKFVAKSAPIVRVLGSNVQELESIQIDLSEANVIAGREPISTKRLSSEPALYTREFGMFGKPLRAYGAEMQLELHASNLRLDQAPLPNGELLLLLRTAESGDFRAEIMQKDVERMIAEVAGKLAQKQGVTIEKVDLQLEQPAKGIVEFSVSISARKLLFRPVLQLSGRVALTSDLSVTISNLRCHGSGPIASLACAAISSQFRRIEGRAFPLSAVPLGQLRLQDLAIELNAGQIFVTGDFGEVRAA